MPNDRMRKSLAAITLALVAAAGCGSDDPASPPTTEFTLAPESNPTIIALGASKTTFVRVTRVNGFTNPVQFTLSDVQGPLSVGIGGTAVADSMRVDITVAANAQLGSYTFKVSGTALGAAKQELTMTVTAAVAGSAQSFLR